MVRSFEETDHSRDEWVCQLQYRLQYRPRKKPHHAEWGLTESSFGFTLTGHVLGMPASAFYLGAGRESIRAAA